MSQKREKDETEFKVPKTIPICMPLPPITASPADVPSSRPSEKADPDASVIDRARTISDSSAEERDLRPPRGAMKRPREENRCSGSGCRKRIGLIGFRCRCGDVFCSEHRYSDRHDCSYDYKAAGREAISRENPVVKAAKLLKV